METILKEYHKTSAENGFIKLEVYYDLGGYSYATYREKPRGYYVGVIPVEREDRGGYCLESFAAFTGGKLLLKECNRRSKKAEAEALAILTDELKQGLIRQVLPSGQTLVDC